ncbi:proliferation marker protein Ki-67 isoform X5 [Oreochromis niloticus]|uniref:proliferation marker protein Ki-67 isoform X3 n=1 Tax=Oreochromis niloticus TaxID=8128 RepID=UPI00025FCD78|nr:proliferation marker protein Ki-67 isoform X3 [Oreochromis niloticus]XP_019218303.1 proliferation marker protein Ki-67 isoform X4 [Oreochromis niloticus]XP_025765724.1 proliferation marker protein Ki-67 isoform X5 [Oreochromis niloticus]
MPLHGKIVVIKRSGGDGTEFPLTAACLFGRKPDCDIRIQLPQVSKEHCRIDLNENKEVILTNLSSANPTRVNGEVLQQSERLKHGDVITIIDRSFRFEYPPAPTPKKRSAIGGKPETLKVLQDQQVGDTPIVEKGEKRFSEVSSDTCLKDGANHDNIQHSLEKTGELESKADDSLLQGKNNSPFSDLYQMIKKSLDVKTPRKSCASQLETPSSKVASPKPNSVRKGSAILTERKSTPKKSEVLAGPGSTNGGTPASVSKQAKVPAAETAEPRAEKAENGSVIETASPRKRNGATPQKFTVNEVVEQITAETPKSPARRRSKETSPGKTPVTKNQDEKTKASPRNSAGKGKEVSKKRKSAELGEDLPKQQTKRKRVSFGGYLSPELFDKRLPPDSPLRKGATPRRSLSLLRPKQSLLRRASVIGLLKEGSPRAKSPAKTKTPSPKKSPSKKTASPKTPTSVKKSPKSRSPSPAKKSPKSRSPSPAKKSPKSRSPSPAKKSPKSRSPSPAKKSPKSRSPSPKAASPANKSPKSRSASPKATANKSPKSKSPSPARGRSPSKVETPKTNEQQKSQRRASTPGQIPHKQVPAGKRRATVGLPGTSLESAPAVILTPAKTPTNSGVQAPTVKGRFSVSQISTPSPIAEADKVTDQVLLPTVTPKTHKGRKSTSQKTPGAVKSAVKMHRRSGISRASIKVSNPWAHIVKFGQPKAQVVAPLKKTIAQKPKKKAVPKPQTPARNLKGYVSTGHADSPATIVVGRAHRQTVVQPTGAAPRVVTNVALFKKNMKMDEDLTGISEMFKTPVNERKRKSLIDDNVVTKTPAGGQSASVMEPSVLNTPEEPGEMIVSPLSVTSAVKGRRYNSEAVQRLLDEDQDATFMGQIQSESSERQSADLQTSTVTTPKQRPELPDSLTGVKRIMKTPKQKAEPVEDLRGKLLKTPKQKPEKQECLTGVKRIMKTPRQKAEPLEDIRGNLLKTPKQKAEQQECFTGVKRIFRTPKEKAEPLEDLRGKILKTPKAPEGGDASLDGVKELLQTPAQLQESDAKRMKTPKTMSSPVVHLTGIKKIMKTPMEKGAPVVDMVDVKRLMRTPRQKGEPVEANFGLKRLMKSPRLRGNAPVEDFEGLQELMEEPLTEPTVQPEAKEQGEAQMSLDSSGNVEKDAMETVSQADAVLLEEAEVKTAVNADPAHEKKSVRGRRAKTVESKAAQDKQEAPDSAEEPVIPAPSRGRRGKKTEATAPPAVRQTPRRRNAKTAVELSAEENHLQSPKVAPKPKRGRSAQQSSKEPEVAAEAERVQSQPLDVEEKANESAVPKRGRRAKQPKESQQRNVTEDVPQDTPDANVACSDQPEVLPGGADENKPDAMETVVQAPQAESLLHVQTPVSVQKKSVQGRRAKQAESEELEDKKEAAEIPEDPIVPTPARGERRGKKMEAAAPPAARHTKRGRNAKSQESTSETSADVSAQASVINTSQEKYSALQTEEAVAKPVRGRRAKRTPVEPAQPEPVTVETASGEQGQVENAEPQKPTLPTAGKSRRGRKARQDTAEQNEVTEEVVEQAAVETNAQSQPPARVKRGRNAKQDEEKMNEPAKKIKLTKSEQAQTELTEEAQTAEMVISETTEPAQIRKEASVATKPRRGGRKAKQDTEIVESIDVKEVPVVNENKPKRGRRGKQAAEETKATAENPEHKPEAEEEKNAEPLSSSMKTSRSRGVRASAKCETSQAIPAKRARRGTTVSPEEVNTESTVLVSEPARTSVEPARKGRRGALKSTTEEPTTTTDQKNPEAVESNAKMSKRCVKWKSDLEVFEIPKATPVKAVRGRKPKAADQVNSESKIVSNVANKTEEEDLSGKAVDSRPVKRVGRGAKTAAKVEPANNPKKTVEAETQPKTRRGRSANK